MVTDKQYQDLLKRIEELSQMYNQMSRDIASIQMSFDVSRARSNSPKRELELSRKDVTRYRFMGELMNKRRLVLECIKKYISDTGITAPEKLLEVFPDYIQGSLGVIRPVEQAELYSNATDRYYFNDEDVLQLDGGIYVVSKDWTVNNIDRFIKVMRGLGYEIEVLERD